MPVFRENKAGHFFNISSIGGYVGGYAGWGAYCAGKFAVAGLTEALHAETNAMGIKSTVVYPGAFRTDFLSKTSLKTPSDLIGQYKEARTSQEFYQNELSGNQQGSPEKFAEAIIEISRSSNPPLHLFLGRDTYNATLKKMDIVRTDLEKWKELSFSTSFE
ncbi:SDR family NAD(P)-dependent oxidoreductase [Flavobacterium procerum]|uniref:SDR family NAD(P)-dependent oxidoreductase n=1 Tax=Flavobacterium procerum TaxID=1455569 RepID=A0ABV6BR13_9FLAO